MIGKRDNKHSLRQVCKFNQVTLSISTIGKKEEEKQFEIF